MPLILLLLFVGVPLGELALLLWIAENTHWSYPLGLVILTGVLGVVLMRLQGAWTYRRIQQSMSAGELPTDPLIDTGLMLFAGGLLLTPGVVTDLLGLSLLFPPSRAIWRHQIKMHFKGKFQFTTWGADQMNGHPLDETSPPDGENVIDGEVVDRDETNGVDGPRA